MTRYYEQEFGKVPSVDDLRASLHEIVGQITDYQAVRWALQDLREMVRAQANERQSVRTAGLFDLPNRLTDKDGKLPPSLKIAECRETAHGYIKRFVETVQTITIQDFEDHLQRYLADFKTVQIQENDFRSWFHGKDVLAAWVKHDLLRELQLDKDHYTKWAAQHLDFSRYPDLLAFQRICWFDETRSDA